MSYILDALKKSERKRPPGPVPDLFTVRGPQPAARSRRPLMMLTGGVVIAALAAASLWAVLGGRSEGPPAMPAPASDGPAQPRPMSSAAPVVEVPVGPAVTALRPAPEDVSPRVASRDVVAKRSPADTRRLQPLRKDPVASSSVSPPSPAAVAQRPAVAQTPVVAPPPVVPAPAATVPVVPPQAVAVPATPTAPMAPTAPVTPAAPAAPPAVVGTAEPAPSSPAPVFVPASAVAVPAPAPQEVPPADPPPPEGRVVDIEELPQGVRSLLGKFSVSGHVWSEEPALRLLTVENRIVRQGQEAAPGVRLEEITQEGAVFSARGWRFRVSAF